MSNTNLFLVLGIATLAAMAGLMVSQHYPPQVKPDLSLFNDLAFDGELGLRFAEFNEWAQKHGRNYGEQEKLMRFRVWNKNYDFVQDHNSQNHTYEVEMNKFADLSVDEFAALHLGFLGGSSSDEIAEIGEEGDGDLNGLEAPSEWSWEAKGAVSSVKDQQTCGSCYAFASSGTLEGLYRIKGNPLIEFSAQQLVDCTKGNGNQGCNGGLMTNTYPYTAKNGIDRWSDYPYINKEGSCRHSSMKPVFKNSGYKNVQKSSTSNKDLLEAAYKNPVSIGIKASSQSFQLYKGGVFSDRNCGTNLDHAIVVVAYGGKTGGKYWKVKNSWGPSWGEKGFIRILRATGDGICGMNTMVSYPY